MTTTPATDARSSETPLLEVRNLVKEYPTRQAGKVVHACSDISVTLRRGETLGVIGESGSGKTTFGRCVLRLVEPTSGEILFEGRDLTGFGASDLRKLRDDMQIVFQEPFDSLNPQMTIGRQVAEPLRIHTNMNRSERAARSRELLAMVGLPANVANRLPRALTPGALQRASIARAIATDPKLIVLDEPTSALSPESEVEIIKLLQDLQNRLGLAYIFISHDLSLVGAVSDQVAVMYLSEVVETGPRDRVFSNPRHPYSHALLGSVLLPYYSDTPAERKTKLDGEIPSPIDLPPGCYLASRCMHANDVCRSERQTLTSLEEPNHLVRCHRVIKGEI